MRSAAAVLAILTFPGGSDAGTREELQAIVAAMAQRHSQYNPLRVKYTAKIKYTPYFFSAHSDVEPTDIRAFSKFKEIDIVSTGDYVLKGNNFYRMENKQSVGARGGRVSKDKIKSWYIVDGNVTISASSNANSYAITRGPEARPTGTLVESTGDRILLDVGESARSETEFATMGVSIADDVTVSGAVTRVTIAPTAPGAKLFTVWLGPAAAGRCVHRYETKTRPDNQMISESSNCTYRQLDGIWYPHSTTVKDYYNWKGVHALSQLTTTVIDEITFRGNDIPDKLFDTTIPAGATVVDRDRNNAVISDPVEAQKAIEEAIKHIPIVVPRKPTPRWVYAVGGCVASFSLAFFVRRLWFRSRPATPTAGA